MALETDRWTRMPASMRDGFAALDAPDSDVPPETKAFILQVLGDNIDLMFRYQQTGGTVLPYEDAHGTIPWPT